MCYFICTYVCRKVYQLTKSRPIVLLCLLNQITLTTEFVPLGGNSYECQYRFNEMTFSRSATNSGSVFMCESPSEEQLRPIVQANRGGRRRRAQREGRRVGREAIAGLAWG